MFGELEQAGTISRQFAEALGTPEAKLEDIENRAALVGSALKEAFELGASGNQVDYLRERLTDLLGEAEALQAVLNGDAGQAAILGRLGSDAESYNPAPDLSGLGSQQLRFAEGEARQAEAARDRAEKERIAADTAAATRERVSGLVGDLQGALAEGAGNVRDYVEGVGTIFETLLNRVEQGTARTNAILRQLETDAGSYSPVPDSSGTTARQQEQQDYLIRLLGTPGYTSYTEPPDSSANPLMPKRGGYNQAPALRPGEREIDEGDQWDRLFDANNDLILDAAEQFNQSIADAGLDFASNVANALADGKITGDEASGIGGALGYVGGSALGTLLLGPIGGQLGSIAGGLLGGLFGGLFGGNDEEDSRSRAAKDLERRGGASTVTFNLFNSMVNNYNGSPADPGVAAQYDRNLRKSVEEILKQADLGRVAKRGSTT